MNDQSQADQPYEASPREHKVRLLLEDPVAKAKQRLMDFAASLPRGGWNDYSDEYEEELHGEVSYEELIERATAFQEHGEYWSEGGRFESQDLYAEFWDDYALVTKKPVTETYGFFSCSC